MSQHSSAARPVVDGMAVSPIAGPSDPGPEPDAPNLRRVASWPAADRESPAGPIQFMSPSPESTGSAASQAACPLPISHRDRPANTPTACPALARSFGPVAFMLFEVQRPVLLVELRTLTEARSESGNASDNQHRGRRTHADAFALLGEIGFLDF